MICSENGERREEIVKPCCAVVIVPGFQVHSALYGDGKERYADVTTVVKDWVSKQSWPTNWEEILYATRKPRTIAGYQAEAVVSTNAVDTAASLRNLSTGLVIHSAVYGVKGDLHGQSIDIADRIRELVTNNSLDIIVNNSTLTPNQNPFRGKKKRLLVRYSFDGGEVVEIARDEKDWLIIGPVQPRTVGLSEIDWSKVPPKRVEKINSTDDELHRDGDKGTVVGENEFGSLVQWDDGVPAGRVPQGKIRLLEHETGYHGDRLVRLNESAAKVESHLKRIVRVTTDPPLTPAALNDYLIRKFSISPQRLRGPMPIELRDFHRNDLARLFAELGFKRGAEIGVAEGNYSEILMKANPTMELLCVDPWHSYSGNPQNKTKEKNEYAYNEAKRKLCQPDWRVKLIPLYSMEAVRDVKDGSLDMVYIDGAHSYNYVLMDIICWSAKVRSGGIIALDDYFFIDRKRWGAGVVEAVQSFTSAHQINPWFICDAHRSVDAFWVNP